ncbi:MAG: Atu2307/SP_0267 family LLM class monooxygenase [Bacteroidota bacterium]
MELGLYTFVENTPDPNSGIKLSPKQRIANLMEEIKLADEVGLDVYAIGEHHREEFIASSPSTLLAAAATITKQIRLSSSVIVLGSEDPVRVFQQFATIDLLSAGRAELMIGRGSFIESFPLFGQDLKDYDAIFSEKLELLLQLREQETITWHGEHRPSIENRSIFPQPLQRPLPLWIAVGGTPESAYRAGALGVPMALAIIGGQPSRFTPFADLHRKGASDHEKEAPKLSINSHGFLAETSQKAKEIAFPPLKNMMDQIGRERGWPPMSYEQFEQSTQLQGANFVGDPQALIDKILYQHELFNHDRFLLQLSVGSIPHADMMRAIELYGTKVAPVVKKELHQVA